MAFFATCSICGAKKLAIFIDADGLCSVCQTKMISQREAEERELKEKQKEEIELKKRQLEQQKEAELKKQEALEAAEKERRRKAVDEYLKQIRDAHAAYDAMVSSIQDSPIIISEKPSKKIGAAFVSDLTYSTITKKTDITKIGNFVVVDTETTGLRYSTDEVIDIAAIRFRNFEPVAKFSTLLSPHKPIPAEVTNINHITDEMVIGKPYFQQIAEALLDFIGDDNIVGHNLQFDLKFIVHYGANVSLKKRKYFDTLAIAKRTIKKTKMKWDKDIEDYIEEYDSDRVDNYKLKTLCSYFGIINRDAHRAESDALATGFLFQELAELRTE